MLFFKKRYSTVLQRALQSAIASHRPSALEGLLRAHGDRAFADALSRLSERAIADALSMLSADSRSLVINHLPHMQRQYLQPLVWSRTVNYHEMPKRITNHSRRWSRYERLSFSMLFYTWGILVLTVTLLHVGNYHLETKTSSTSGTHSGFHGTTSTLRPSEN
ncbi:hypothetical protein AAEX37_00511 [Oligella sp. MSHR50489EDL]|uniref:hypothetical protein n=1 Tax=Oligella sp. MSHR50489EDL TaxID=3139409 RepID=UPI003D818613